MPRLGTDSSGVPDTRRPVTVAYAQSPQSSPFVRIAVLLCTLFLARNILFRDYRQEAITYLQTSGHSTEQIEQYIPSTVSEHRKKDHKQQKSMEQLQQDVTTLQEQVKSLQQVISKLHPEVTQHEHNKQQ